MIGAGHQSGFQLRAAIEQRAFRKVVAWNHHPDKLDSLAKIAEEAGLAFERVERDQLGTESDVIITITSAHEALLLKDWVKPGTHIASMGTDTAGKQEIDPQLISAATLFTDEIAQSISIGETQHAIASKLITADDITPIGEVINGDHPGRTSVEEITVFDGTGVGLQDLAVASAATRLAVAQGIAQEASL
jgi:ornithine cyclodeaminase